MPFCPNPDCPHRKRLNEVADYLPGVTTCSDCGSSLSDTHPLLPSIEKPKKVIITDFRRRLLLTLLLLLFWNLLRHIGAPGINYEALSKLAGDSTRAFNRISLFSLGLMPYVTAYVLVELCALFLPPLKSWRENGYAGRANLVSTARWITLVLALVQAYYLARGLENMSSWQAVYQPGLEFRLILMITLTAGTFLMIWIADMISSWGIGHGISLLIFSSYVYGLPHYLEKAFNLYEGPNPLKHFLGVAIALLIIIAIVIVVERTYSKLSVRFDDGREAYMPIKLTTAGIIPSSWVADIMLYPATLAGFIVAENWRQLAIAISPGKLGYYIGTIISIFLFYFIFSSFFYRPKSIILFLQNKGAMVVDNLFDDAAKSIRYKWVAMAFVGALYLCLFFLLRDISFYFTDTPISGLALMVTAVIALDFVTELRIRRYSGTLVKVAEFQKPMEAGLLRSLLKQHKIPCQLRGYYHRALLYFFGPYIEISVFVPEEKAIEANDVIAKYLKLT